ncbi:hypothetical protein [Roseibium sp. Sym1]|uniref:hypothetical protein n=1 Tax=Roseibium sp. Sym1 TaxID=3016006 RepID=UPI0022B3B7D9|nr:hypothetical protein [Roseibium sp. Sym1]
MHRRTIFPVFLRTVLAAAFLLAGGTFSHAFADMPHDHAHALEANVGDNHTHADTGPDGHAAERETVHCGAYLLALTADAHLSVPELVPETGTISPVSVFSRTANLDPPPPRDVPLSA